MGPISAISRNGPYQRAALDPPEGRRGSGRGRARRQAGITSTSTSLYFTTYQRESDSTSPPTLHCPCRRLSTSTGSGIETVRRSAPSTRRASRTGPGTTPRRGWPWAIPSSSYPPRKPPRSSIKVRSLYFAIFCYFVRTVVK